jgi:divalent metal cation (Fe/Co/Zn/Cd) transporter
MKEWARKLFSVLLAVGVFVGVIMIIGYVSAFSKGGGLFALPSDPEFKPLIITVMTISFLFSIVLIAAAVWIIVKLNSVKIKSLFETTVSNGQR